MTLKIDGRRNTLPARGNGKTFVVGAEPTGVAAGHANEFAFDYGGTWAFRAPIRGERIEFTRNGATEVREWNGRRWRKLEEAPELADLPAGATRGDIARAFNLLLAACRKANVIDDPSPAAPGGD